MVLITPELFFAANLAAAVCVYIAILVIKSSANAVLVLKTELSKWLFFLYSAAAVSLSLFPIVFDSSTNVLLFKPANINFVPLRTIFQTLNILVTGGISLRSKLSILGTGIAANLFLFIPFGYLLPLICKKFRKALPMAIFASALSLVIEAIQYVESGLRLADNRSSNIDDILLAAAGALIGRYLWANMHIPE